MLLSTWLSILAATIGACIGSFLNVVIYRLPRGLAVNRPSRSFCPHCGRGVAGYDNVPVLSYVWLRGRCRQCRAPISVQYPIVELTAALLFVATVDVFLVARWRDGLWQWPGDAPIVLAHGLLWAGLLATSVMDIEAYYLDIRVTWVIAGVGVTANAIWTPTLRVDWIRPGPASAAGTVAAVAVLGLMTLWAVLRGPGHDGPAGVDTHDAAGMSPPTDAAGATPAASAADGAESAQPRAGLRRPGPVAILAVVVGAAGVIGYIVWMAVSPTGPTTPAAGPGGAPPTVPGLSAAARLAVATALLLVAITLAGSIPRDADTEVFDAIEAESESARRTVLGELGWLAPAAVAFAGVAAVVAYATPEAPPGRLGWLGWSVGETWRPLLGLATGLHGWLIAGAFGWVVRIGFTLMFGREALGVGDIHILAAAGAVAGWPVVVIGFFLSAPLALLGAAVFALRRRSRAIQYGPWLGLGMFLAAAAQDRIIDSMHLRWLLH